MGNNNLPEQTNDIVRKIKSGDARAFEVVFKRHYQQLHNLAIGILKDSQLAEEQVQEVFVKVWERREQLRDELKLFPYLLTSVRNRCFNYLRDQQVAQKYIDYTQQQQRDQILRYDYEDLDEEVIAKLHAVINTLPDKCQEVFRLSRFDRLSHKEIAARLDISTKTIERHITKALKTLKAELLGVLKILILLVGDLW